MTAPADLITLKPFLTDFYTLHYPYEKALDCVELC